MEENKYERYLTEEEEEEYYSMDHVAHWYSMAHIENIKLRCQDQIPHQFSAGPGHCIIDLDPGYHTYSYEIDRYGNFLNADCYDFLLQVLQTFRVPFSIENQKSIPCGNTLRFEIQYIIFKRFDPPFWHLALKDIKTERIYCPLGLRDPFDFDHIINWYYHRDEYEKKHLPTISRMVREQEHLFRKGTRREYEAYLKTLYEDDLDDAPTCRNDSYEMEHKLEKIIYKRETEPMRPEDLPF